MRSEGTALWSGHIGLQRDQWTTVLHVLAVTSAYLLLHPYLGITHDARLYTLQALNHLHPELYGNDIFLLHGSQDDYTAFTPLYAMIISWLGVEPAAALLTFFSQMAFVTAAGLLARSLLPTNMVLAAIGLLLLLPDHYGASRIFTYLEEFITPRLLAESLVLFGLAAWFQGMRRLSMLLLVGAMLTHPIMGLSGVALVASMALVIPRWRRLWPLAPITLIATALVAAMSRWIPTGWRLDDEWLSIVLARADYISLVHWSGDDWGRVAVLAATLAIAVRVLSGNMQRVAIATLISTGALLLLTLVGGELLRISLVIQAQPWRALWLATVIAILLLPPLLQHCWRDGELGRSGMLLLIAAWLCPSEQLSLLLAPLAAGVAYLSDCKYARLNSRILLLGSSLALSLVTAVALATSVLSWEAGSFNVSTSPWLDALRSATAGGTPILALLMMGWWTTTLAPRLAPPALAGILLLFVSAAIGPMARTWFDIRYSQELKDAFATWRAHIPPGSDVIWAADSTAGADSATSIWLLLERPSFISRIQTTTSLFSRAAAFELRDRAQSIIGRLPDIGSLDTDSPQRELPQPLNLHTMCDSTHVKYVVTHASFADAVPIAAPMNVRYPFRNLGLYTCP